MVEHSIVKDPVCGSIIREEKISLRWGEKTILFCDNKCKLKFQKAPEKYLKKRSWLRRKWDRYLEKINKQTGGNPPCCH